MIVSVQVADNVGVRSDEFSFATCPMIGYGAVLGATPSHGAFLCVFSHFEKGGSSILYDYTFPFVDEMGHFKRLQNMLILIAYKQCKNISLVSFYSRFSRQLSLSCPFYIGTMTVLAFGSNDHPILRDYKSSTIEGFFLGTSPAQRVFPTQQGTGVIVAQIID